MSGNSEDPTRGSQVNTVGRINVVPVAQDQIKDRVLAAELFVPNAKDFGIDLFALVSVFAEWIAISNGGLTSLAVWAVTSKELHIFRAHQQILGGIRISERLGVWNLSEIEASEVPGKGRHNSFAIRFRDAQDEVVEMRPIVISEQAAAILSKLVTESHAAPSDLGHSRSDTSRPTLRSIVTLGFSAAFSGLMLAGDASDALKLGTVIFALSQVLLTALVLAAKRTPRRQSLLLLTQSLISGVVFVVLSAWYFLGS